MGFGSLCRASWWILLQPPPAFFVEGQCHHEIKCICYHTRIPRTLLQCSTCPTLNERLMFSVGIFLTKYQRPLRHLSAPLTNLVTYLFWSKTSPWPAVLKNPWYKQLIYSEWNKQTNKNRRNQQAAMLSCRLHHMVFHNLASLARVSSFFWGGIYKDVTSLQ